MEFAPIIEVISTLGFPIAVCLALGWFIWIIFQKMMKQRDEDMKAVGEACHRREEKLYEEIKENRIINGRFAEIISKYDVKLDNIQKDVEDIKTVIYSKEK